MFHELATNPQAPMHTASIYIHTSSDARAKTNEQLKKIKRLNLDCTKKTFYFSQSIIKLHLSYRTTRQLIKRMCRVPYSYMSSHSVRMNVCPSEAKRAPAPTQCCRQVLHDNDDRFNAIAIFNAAAPSESCTTTTSC